MDDEPREPPNFGSGEWNLIKELFFEYQTDSPADLDSWLAAKCPSPAIRSEVERLIRAGRDSAGFLEDSASEQYLGIARPHPVRIGRYRIIEELGAGGLGVVYAAWDEQVQRRVAVKVLHARAVGDPQLRKRLLWDAKAAGGLQHPNIVVIYEIGSDNGQDYVAMECVSGRTLGRLLEFQAGGLEPRVALDYAIQIARGLEAAHHAGIVHRDLKPGNIMIADDGVVKLLDFGLAKNEGGFLGGADAPTTIEGRFAGTVAYVSPEQAEGRPVDARSDIFSFGCVLFEMLTGRQAFRGNTALSVLASILQGEPPDLQSLRPILDYHLEEIVRGCLRKNPAERLQSMKTVRDRLEDLIRDETVELPRARPAPARAWRTHAIAAAALLCGLALGLAPAWRARPAVSTPWVQTATRRRVTFDDGLTGFPALAPDGRMIAYASDRAGKGSLNLWIQYTEGGEARQLTYGSADDYAPVFSADSRRIVYRSERENGGELRELTWFSGADRPLVPGGRGPQFSPDGASLAYWKGEPGASLYPGSAATFLIPRLGGAERRLFADFDAALHPVWSPKGDKLLFLGRRNGITEWWVGAVSGSEARSTGILERLRVSWVVAPPPGQYYLVPAAWLANNTVLFSGRKGDATNIWALRIDDVGNPVDTPSLWTAGTGLESQPNVRPSDARTQMAYAALNIATAVWRAPLDSHGRAAGPAAPLIAGYGDIASPSVNQAGTRLVLSTRQEGSYAIRIFDLPPSTPKLLTAEQGKSQLTTRPILSRDGRVVVYRQEKKAYVMPVNGSVSEPICDVCGPPTDISPDGAEVLLESPRAPERLLLGRRSRQPQPLLSHVAGADDLDQYAGRFSPDRRWVVFQGVLRTTHDRRIYLAPVAPAPNGGGTVVAVSDGPSDYEPAWSPDGKRIYFLSRRDGFLCVWARNIDPAGRPEGPVEEILHFHHARYVISGPSPYIGEIGLSAAAGSLFLTVAETSGNIWIQSMPPL